MASIVPRFASLVNFASQRHDGLAMVGVACFLLLASSASAQAKTSHYWSRSSTHYSAHHKSANRVHSLDRKPHSVPSQLAPEVVGKPSGRAALSANKELDQLERASVVKPTSVKSEAWPASANSALAPEKHSPPINFTHKESPQSPYSGAAKIH